MKQIYNLAILAFIIAGCTSQDKDQTWQLSETIALEGVNPIGIAASDNGIWLSDGDHNRVVLIDDNGKTLKVIDSLDRPMHIATEGNEIIIPQYGNDEVIRFRESAKTVITTKDSLDAPAGVDVRGNEIAIADFYNNKIHYSSNGTDWMTFGKEGKADGDFYYPTDVQITENEIWVADAYNNRVQSFTKNGTHIRTVGVDQDLNAATGIFVTENEIFVTDFENNRIVVFDMAGRFKQEIKDGISKPTDVLVRENKLYVTNYKGSNLTAYTLKEALDVIPEEEHDHDDHEH
ncbi:hypothetical protein EAX61_12140 [Dokdonia sinensis]|uniref:6-bladed beta-propeller n=1 Tax=Dokdonia sinensis TaxID=2479847 RepID=A0A3M0FWT2_9FLAO|nr:NHL repeat-containing protein [Dokdonia sinensis]RMB57114.1 hypothetical protein EAX61_12140 [Dokdonia sinensis]